MKLFGFDISRTKAAPPVPVDPNRGGWFRIMESFTGAWQQNVTVDFNSVLANHAVFACMTLIASDISKLRVKLVEQDAGGIWTEVTAQSPFQPVLRKPNRMQNRIQFWENYVLSKLMRGNTYVLLVRDNRQLVVREIVLAPDRVTPMISDDGTVFYKLKADNVGGIADDVMVPASEIIHDRFNCIFHPLVGQSPIFAAGVAAMQGLAIQNNSTQFFANKSQPGGILTSPGQMSDETALKLKEKWEANFTGANAGRIAIVGDGLHYEPITLSASDTKLIEQFKWSAEIICSCFHVPPYKVGIGEMPKYSNIQALNVEYYSQCLQILIEAAELCQDEGLGLDMPKDGKQLGTEFDIDNLLRMDSVTQIEVLDKARSIMTPDEQRAKLSLPSTEGGDKVYRQQQDFSLEALAKRDAQDDPFASQKKPAPALPPDPAVNDNQAQQQASNALIEVLKGLG